MIDDKILNYFKEHRESFVSGEDLGVVFGISRTAVWKHIEKFRSEGYEILASPHHGYKLVSVPDRLTEMELKWELGTDTIGKRIYSYNEVASTNDVAYQLASQGEEEGSVVVAEYQTKGRGRLGRKWVSPKGKGAYFSVILRPEILPREVSLITLFSALSVAKTIREDVGLSAFIKWPNDILINGGKVSGILTEMSGEIDRIHFIVVGIGININTKKELLPEGAASLASIKGKELCRVDFVQSILRNIEKYYGIFRKDKIGDMLEEYKELSSVLDKQVQINYDNNLISGHAIDVDKEGALILRLDTGFQKRVLAGDVVMLR